MFVYDDAVPVATELPSPGTGGGGNSNVTDSETPEDGVAASHALALAPNTCVALISLPMLQTLIQINFL